MDQAAPEKPPISAERLSQEALDLRDRSRPSGVFYLIGWLVIAFASDWFTQAPWISGAVTVVLTSVALLRLSLRVPVNQTADRLSRFIDRCWLLIFTNVLSWTAVTLVTLLTEVPEQVRTTALLCTTMYGSAFGYAYCMRLARARAGLLIIAGPVILLLWTLPGQNLMALAFSIYLLHLMLVSGTSYRSYQQRLDLDIELRRQRNLYQQLSHVDALTGLHNRGHFNGRLTEMLGPEPALTRGFAFALLDIDHFKQINDTLGHDVGDQCLQQLADVLRDCFPGTGEYLARIGGEEFAVLLPELGLEAALERIRALRTRLRNHSRLGDLALTLSVGLGACAAGDRISASTLYQAVDQALYRAKSGGRDQVCPVLSPLIESTRECTS
jgi:diguanylate cyclase